MDSLVFTYRITNVVELSINIFLNRIYYYTNFNQSKYFLEFSHKNITQMSYFMIQNISHSSFVTKTMISLSYSNIQCFLCAYYASFVTLSLGKC